MRRTPTAPVQLVLAALLLAPAACDSPANASTTDTGAAPVVLPANRVQVATATRGELDLASAATGQLHAFRSVTVAAEAPGRVVARDVERGQRVDQGRAMFRVDASRARLQYRQAHANEEAAAIDLELAQRELGRADQLIAAQDISRSRHDKMAHSKDAADKRRELARINRRLARRAVADANVAAPFDGQVVALHAELGDYVGPGTPLATIADLSRLRLRVGVTAAEAHELSRRPDLQVDARFDELGGTTARATLHDVAPLADPRSGTYTAEFWLEQLPGEPLREGMVARLDLGGLDPEPAVLVPRQSVTRHRDGFSVWVVVDGESGPVAQRRPVVLGRHDAEHTEVRRGLEPGERVVTRGMFALAEGHAVEIDGAAE